MLAALLEIINSKINYERKIEMAKHSTSKRGINRASKFNEAHRLTAFKEGDNVLVKALSEDRYRGDIQGD